jgi:hypothetical protein
VHQEYSLQNQSQLGQESSQLNKPQLGQEFSPYIIPQKQSQLPLHQLQNPANFYQQYQLQPQQPIPSQIQSESVKPNQLYEQVAQEQAMQQDVPLFSKNGKYYLIVQGDGNIVIYQAHTHHHHQHRGTPIWSTDTFGKGQQPFHLIL